MAHNTTQHNVLKTMFIKITLSKIQYQLRTDSIALMTTYEWLNDKILLGIMP